MAEPTKNEKLGFVAKAKRELIEENQARFDELVEKAYAEAGYEYARPLTPEQEAVRALDEIRQKYPHLLSGAVVAAAVHGAQAAPVDPNDPTIDPEIPEGEDPWAAQ